MSKRRHSTPWYRERWPWLLMVPPFTAVVGGFITLVLAIQSWDGLVSDDYYKEGLAIQQRIDRVKKAAELGVRAGLSFRDDLLVLRLSAEQAMIPPFLNVRFIHPTQSGMDRSLNLVRDGDRYWAPLTLPVAGRWRVEIEDESRTWRLTGTIQIPTESEALIVPQVPQ